MATGTRNFGQYILIDNNSDRIDEDFETFIDYDDATMWPMAAFLAKKSNSVQKGTTEFTLFSGELIPRAVTLQTAITTTDETAVIEISSTNGIVPGTLIHVNGLLDGKTTGELLRCAAVTTRISVQRLTTVAGIADNAVATIIGNTDTETSTTGPAAFDMEPASVVGQMTILKRRIDISKTERNSDVRGSRDRLAEKLERAKMDFMLDQEHSAWFSVKTNEALSDSRIKTSMGIHEQLAGGTGVVVKDMAGALLTHAGIGDAVSDFAKYAKNSNIHFFHGRYGMDAIYQLGQANVVGNGSVTDKVVGSAANRFSVGAFSLTCVYARVFDIIGAPYSSMLFGLDMSQIKNVHLKEGRSRLQRNVQDDDSGEKESHQFRSQGGISITWPTRHFMVIDQT